MLRPGNVHSAHNWREVLDPIVARYGRTGVRRYFRADAAFAKPEVYEYLEERRVLYAISITTTVQGGMWGEARSAARRLAWERLARSLLSCVSSSHRSNSAGPNRSLGSNSRTTR